MTSDLWSVAGAELVTVVVEHDVAGRPPPVGAGVGATGTGQGNTDDDHPPDHAAVLTAMNAAANALDAAKAKVGSATRAHS